MRFGEICQLKTQFGWQINKYSLILSSSGILDAISTSFLIQIAVCSVC